MWVGAEAKRGAGHAAALIAEVPLLAVKGGQGVCLRRRWDGSEDPQSSGLPRQKFHFLGYALVMGQRQLGGLEVFGAPIAFDEDMFNQTLAAQGLEFAVDAGGRCNVLELHGLGHLQRRAFEFAQGNDLEQFDALLVEIPKRGLIFQGKNDFDQAQIRQGSMAGHPITFLGWVIVPLLNQSGD